MSPSGVLTSTSVIPVPVFIYLEHSCAVSRREPESHSQSTFEFIVSLGPLNLGSVQLEQRCVISVSEITTEGLATDLEALASLRP